MAKKGLYYLTALFILILFLTSCSRPGSAPASTSPDIWQTLSDDTKFLGKTLKLFTVDLAQNIQAIPADGIPTTADQRLALFLTKILFFLLVFTILYGVSATTPTIKSFQRNQRIVITAAIALIATITIQPKWIIDFVKLTGTVIILGPLIGLAAFGYYGLFEFFGERPKRGEQFVRFIMCGLLVWVVTHIGNIWDTTIWTTVPNTQGVNFVFGVISFALNILWIFTALYALYIAYLIIAGEGTTPGTPEADQQTRKKAIQRWRAQGKTRTVNDYVAEEKELEKIQAVEQQIDHLEDDLNLLIGQTAIHSAAQISQAVNDAAELEHRIKAAKDYFRTVKRKTHLQQTGVGGVVDYLDSIHKDTAGLKAKENQILLFNRQAADALQAALTKCSNAQVLLKKAKTAADAAGYPVNSVTTHLSGAAGPTIQDALGGAKTILLGDLRVGVETARTKIEGAMNDLTSITSEVDGFFQ